MRMNPVQIEVNNVGIVRRESAFLVKRCEFLAADFEFHVSSFTFSEAGL
jgi:hypothetical protein